METLVGIRRIAVALALTMAVPLALPAPAHAAPKPAPVTVLINEASPASVAALAGTATTIATISPDAATTCTLTAYTPSTYNDGATVWVTAVGFLQCNNSVEQMSMQINVYRDFVLIISQSYTANRLPGNKLLSLTMVTSPVCVTGSYIVDVFGAAAWKTGSGSGRATSPLTPISC